MCLLLARFVGAEIGYMTWKCWFAVCHGNLVFIEKNDLGVGNLT